MKQKILLVAFASFLLINMSFTVAQKNKSSNNGGNVLDFLNKSNDEISPDIDPPPVIDLKSRYDKTYTIEESSGSIGTIEPNANEGVYYTVEQMPEFPGGTTAMMKWIRAKIDSVGYPQMEKDSGISGTCYVTFFIDKEGSVREPKILKGVPGGPGYDKVALTVVKAMPKWIAGKHKGRNVSVQYNLPIKFKTDKLKPE